MTILEKHNSDAMYSVHKTEKVKSNLSLPKFSVIPKESFY